MPAYMQMGHDTEGLVGEPALSKFSGVVLSPVNRAPFDLIGDIAKFRERGVFDVLLDPQLYSPRSQRGCIADHPYFPPDLDTADLASQSWWDAVAAAVVLYANRLNVSCVCSPVTMPKKFSDAYYEGCRATYRHMRALAERNNMDSALTLCVSFADMAERNTVLKVASMATSLSPKRCYLVVNTEIEPRRELVEVDALVGTMGLIASLEASGCNVFVSHVSSDVILFKAAGATSCSTGKFFNLRRFTKSRFEEESQGGGQLPYWFEHSLLAFLRQADIQRIRRDVSAELIAVGPSGNEYANRILSQFEESPGTAWLGLSWRQYLAWFCEIEGELSRASRTERLAVASSYLSQAERHWHQLDDKRVLLEESRNDGSWVRRWRQALSDFERLY